MTAKSISQLVRQVFPNTSCKRRGKQRLTHLVGIEPKHELSSCLDMSTSVPLSGGTSTSLTFTASSVSDITTLSNSIPDSISIPSPSTSSCTASDRLALLSELQMEREKRKSLELEVNILKRQLHDVQSATQYKQTLSSEIDSTVLSRNILVHGPDTVERFNTFSMNAVISELKTSCPSVYSLIQQLGSTQRYASDNDDVPDEELKGVMAICTLLNARSAREGNATNDQPDVSCKGIRETGMQSCINVYNVHVHVYILIYK